MHKANPFLKDTKIYLIRKERTARKHTQLKRMIPKRNTESTAEKERMKISYKAN
jgi:hypothetical protein